MPKLCDINFPDKLGTPEGFWSAVEVWIQKPHVVNKRLCGVKLETEGKQVDIEELGHILQAHKDGASELNDVFSFLGTSDSEFEHGKEGVWSYCVRTFIPKVNCYGTNAHKEMILKDFDSQRVTFIPFEEETEGRVSQRNGNIYQLCLRALDGEEWVLELHVFSPAEWLSDGVAYPTLPWLSRELLPRLVRWATEKRTSDFPSTLSLLPVEKYSVTYQRLKDKYKDMVKVWPEVTDPEKFVYEDVAIATYLLVLWGEERAELDLTDKQSFVDLGCGNGLLVHILSNEGHPGKGIDVRRRKIWDMYGPQTLLEETAITPGDGFLFPSTDWLIGNHSDELTPWIPVIAARSSYGCRYFVLPCCFFDFYAKYQRRQCGKSQYQEYIAFISEVSAACGFHTQEDCLRIPSTKRVCLVGRSRTYERAEEAGAEQRRARYIQGRQPSPRATAQRTEVAPAAAADRGGGEAAGSQHGHAADTDGTTDGTNDWGAGFRPRERVEVVRNCAALPRALVDGVVLRVAGALLGLNTDQHGTWNLGGSLPVREVAELLEAETLQSLKKECGGLQTLLRNNHQVFRVEGGRVHIRDWRALPRRPEGERARARRPPPAPGALKTRPCWFHRHHPHGCPLRADDCAFAHGAGELRPSTKPLKKKNPAL